MYVVEFQTSFDLDEGSQMMEEATEKPTSKLFDWFMVISVRMRALSWELR